MAIVVDASVALAALLPDEGSSYARAAFTVATSDGLIVPSLWLYEVQNGLRMAVRRARIVSDFVPAALAALEAIPRDLRIPRRLGRELILAETYGLTVYDEAGTALDADASLASLDRGLERAARAAKVAFFEPGGAR